VSARSRAAARAVGDRCARSSSSGWARSCLMEDRPRWCGGGARTSHATRVVAGFQALKWCAGWCVARVSPRTSRTTAPVPPSR
jgi:hypothetical protein